MHLIEFPHSTGVLQRTIACILSLILLAATCLLAGCSCDRVWRSMDPLGYSRANDAPYLYRGKDTVPGRLPPLLNDDRPRRTYHLPDP